MEQTRLLIAIALSFLIFMIWSFLFPGPKEVPKPEQATKSEQQIEEKTYIKEKEQVIATTTPLHKEVSSKPDSAFQNNHRKHALIQGAD